MEGKEAGVSRQGCVSLHNRLLIGELRRLVFGGSPKLPLNLLLRTAIGPVSSYMRQTSVKSCATLSRGPILKNKRDPRPNTNSPSQTESSPE